jgi:putative regulatory protein cII
MKIITLFNNKGGVSKTTTTFHLGWKLASQGNRVLIVDADPQCNLTQLVLEGQSPEDESIDVESLLNNRNLYTALDPVYNGRPQKLTPVDCLQVNGCEGLYLLPGHSGLAEYESTLGIAQQLSETLGPVRNIPGSFRHLIKITAKKYRIDYTLIDVSPSLGAMNQNIVTSSDRLILPLNPDVFCVQAITSMRNVLPKWVDWAHRAANVEALQSADYPFEGTEIKFLGNIVQRFRLRNNKPTSAFKTYFRRLDSAIIDHLIPKFSECGLLLSEDQYHKAHMSKNYRLETIPEFNTLIAASQASGKPVFALEQDDTGHTGTVWKNDEQKINEIDEIFTTLANRVADLS